MLPGILRFPLAILLLAALNLPALAHEFWIEPEHYQLRSGRDLNASIHIGEFFSGNTHAFFPQRFERFELISNEQSVDVLSRLGDRPAVQQRVTGNNLMTILYESRYDQLTYEDLDLFQAFLELEGIEWVLEAHKERNLPDEGFTELYRRFSKTLIAVGDGVGEDKPEGLLFEWVLQRNPYQTDHSAPLTARLLWQGEPMPDAVARVFARSGGEVESFRLITDENGIIELPRRTDAEYLLNAVHMVAPETEVAESTGAVWESLWASMVFAVGR